MDAWLHSKAEQLASEIASQARTDEDLNALTAPEKGREDLRQEHSPQDP